MRILALPRYGRLAPSSRLRFYQYLPWLERSDLQITVCPLFPDTYVRRLQTGHRSAPEMAGAYLGRIRRLLSLRQFDLLWIEKECLPWLPAFVEHGLLGSAVPYVLDYDDAVFHWYDLNRHVVVRQLLQGKHPSLVRKAALVLAGNPYLAAFAQAAGARQVEILPTVIDLNRYGPAPKGNAASAADPPVIGWIGQRSTAEFLRPLAPLFETLSQQGKARFEAIGIDTKELQLPMTAVPWREDTEIASIRNLDIGLMPLVDAPFERGKCGYKLIQYMACGLPVVASPVGVNRQIVEHGVNGFLAETPAEWATALDTLLANPDLRRRFGAEGRRKVEREFSAQVSGPRLVALLKRAVTRTAAYACAE